MDREHDGRASLVERGALRQIWRSSGGAGEAALVPDSSDRAAWDSIDPAVRDLVLQAADTEHGSPWLTPRLSLWSAFGRTGDRRGHEDGDFAHKRRVRLAILAAAIDPTPARLVEAADGLWTLCEQSSWCWPAHDDSFSRGLMTTDVDRPYLDLGAGEAAALAGWAALVLGDALEAEVPGLLARLRREVERRIFSPLMERHDWQWENGEINNWLPWIVGNVIPAAVAFSHGEQREQLLDRCVDGIDRYLSHLPADGGIDEGFGYWWQGAARAFDALASLDVLCGGAVAQAAGSGGLSGLRELARFPERMQLGDDWFVSFSDAEARPDEGTPWHVLYRAARLCGLEGTASFAAGQRRDGMPAGFDAGVVAGLGRMLAELFDADWRTTVRVAPVLPERVWLPSIGVGLRREAGGSARGLAVVVKGGNNGENHNHNDLGSIAAAVDGVPLLADLGRATYTAKTFSDARYELWYVTSDWHSAPSPLGLAQVAGSSWDAPVREVDDGWSIDLTAAYPWPERETDRTWSRTVRLRDAVMSVVDEGSAVGHVDTRIILVCAGVPDVLTADDAGAASILVPGRAGSRALLLEFDHARVEIETRAVDDAYLRRSWGDLVSRIVFAPAAGTERWELRGTVAGR